ncbi:ATP synthase subunit I [Desulfallas sp. Bu1-1]|uniref:ATP synthase subunit I n=1 Tax=Desulfallas sp. Bu1-1 TaxID=2787620 RepID=UPI0018A02CF2|nr:ATP synthase subunit I [Desulfallas sp. Bu1-1]MBF7081545.1 ATP synthase subunit I [Desulfallas sp. Bu1-1]
MSGTPIRDIDLQYARTTRITALIAALTLPGLVLSPKDPLILGFIVGSVAGIVNCYFLVKRMRMLVEMIMQMRPDRRQAGRKQAKMFMRAGFYPRMGMIIAVIYLAGRIDFINVYGVGAGLLVPTLITVVDANVALYRYFAARNAVDKI